MAPTDKLRPPFRWEFVPVESKLDKAIHWSWCARDHAGKVVMSSGEVFENREDCIEDAMRKGYVPPK
jgi:hypothetical protein